MDYEFQDPLKARGRIENGEEATGRDGYYRDPEKVSPFKLHQISELTEFIRSKMFGADVRESIAQAFERWYQDAIDAGHASAEVGQARGEHLKLSDRLNSMQTKIDNSIRKHHVSLDDLTQEVKEAMTGGSVAVVGSESVSGYSNAIDRTFSLQKMDFTKSTSNHFVEDESKRNHYLDVRPSTNYVGYGTMSGSRVSAKIDITGVNSIYIESSRRIAFFNVNNNFIGLYPDTGAKNGLFLQGANIPSGAKYIIFDYVEGDVRTPTNQVNFNEKKDYEPTFLIPHEVIDFQITNSSLPKGIVSKDKTSFFEEGKNLFNKDKATRNGYVSWLDGSIAAHNDLGYSEPIAIVGGSEYVANWPLRGVAYFNQDKFIAGTQILPAGTVIKPPVNSTHIVLDYYLIREDSLQFEKGGVSSEFEPYTLSLKSDALPPEVRKTERIIALPPKVYGLVGEQQKIYLYNIVEKYADIDVDINGVGKQMDNHWEYTPIATGSEKISATLYRDFSPLFKKESTIMTTSIKKKDRKLLVIGDSTVNAGVMTQQILDRFNQENSSCELVGGRGSGKNRHEGRGGWTVQLYRRDTVYQGETNPFFNNNDFDFSHYCMERGVSGLTDVMFQLGINDIFSLSLGMYKTEIEKILLGYEHLVQSVKKYDASVNVLIAMTIPPNAKQDSFGDKYGTGQTQFRYKAMNVWWTYRLIEHFGNRENERIYIVPQALYINTHTDFSDAVHPNVDGYKKMGDSVYATLKHI